MGVCIPEVEQAATVGQRVQGFLPFVIQIRLPGSSAIVQDYYGIYVETSVTRRRSPRGQSQQSVGAS